MLCWSAYSVLSTPLEAPLADLGDGCVDDHRDAALPRPVLADHPSHEWTTISVESWLLLWFSAVLALAVAYMIWYTGVQQIGSSRTAIYSNLTPVVAMLVATLVAGRAGLSRAGHRGGRHSHRGVDHSPFNASRAFPSGARAGRGLDADKMWWRRSRATTAPTRRSSSRPTNATAIAGR
ncbi:MAG: EamA family transporter [Vicinamibacterales bacterium]